MIYVKKVATAMSLALLLTSGLAVAQSSTVPAEQEVQKNATALLKNSYAYLGSLDKYALKADVTYKVTVDGNNLLTKRESDVKVNRPSQFRVDSRNDTINRSVYLSNGAFTMMDNKEKYYASVKTGKNIDGSLEQISKKLGIVLPLSTLLHSDMNQFIHPKKVQYFGTEKLAGVECNYIAFRQGQGSTIVHMWIENSNTPLIHAAKIVTGDANNQDTTEMVMKWDTSPRFSDSVFVFKAPKGASNVSIKPVK